MILIKEKLWQAVKLPAEKIFNAEIDQKALVAVVLNISSNIYVRTKTAETVKEVWTKLESSFESSGLRHQIVLDPYLYSTKLTDFNRMEGYIWTECRKRIQWWIYGFQIVSSFHRRLRFLCHSNWNGCKTLVRRQASTINITQKVIEPPRKL